MVIWIGRVKLDQLVVISNDLLLIYPIASSKIFNLIEIIFLLRVVNSKQLHENVSWVRKSRHIIFDGAEVGGRFGRVTLVNNVTVTHDNQSIEKEEGLRAGLMNCRADRLSFFSSQVMQE